MHLKKEQHSFWQQKRIRVFQFQLNYLKLTQHDLDTNPIDITTFFGQGTPSSNANICLNKNIPKIKSFKSINSLLFPLPFHYSLNHLNTIGINRDYDPVKQHYILALCYDPARPRFVPQEAPILNENFLLPTQTTNSVCIFFSKNINLLKHLAMITLALYTLIFKSSSIQHCYCKSLVIRFDKTIHKYSSYYEFS